MRSQRPESFIQLWDLLHSLKHWKEDHILCSLLLPMTNWFSFLNIIAVSKEFLVNLTLVLKVRIESMHNTKYFSYVIIPILNVYIKTITHTHIYTENEELKPTLSYFMFLSIHAIAFWLSPSERLPYTFGHYFTYLIPLREAQLPSRWDFRDSERFGEYVSRIN